MVSKPAKKAKVVRKANKPAGKDTDPSAIQKFSHNITPLRGETRSYAGQNEDAILYEQSTSNANMRVYKQKESKLVQDIV